MADPLHEADDTALALRARAGALDAFEELVRRYENRIFRFAKARLGRHADAEDATQNTFIAAYQKLHRYRERYPFAAWLFTIARRKVIDHLRKNPPPCTDLPGDTHRAQSAEPASQLAEQEDAQALWQQVRQALPERQFTAVWLFYGEEAGIALTAQLMGLRCSHVKVLLHRARTRLADTLEPPRPATQNPCPIQPGESPCPAS